MAQEEIFTIDQGSDVAIEMHIVQKDGNPRNIASHAFNMKMKRSYNSTDSADIVDWATIVSDADNGIMTASLTNTQTDALRKGKYLYDVEMPIQLLRRGPKFKLSLKIWLPPKLR